MCYERPQRETDVTPAHSEQEEQPPVWEKTTPRGNQEPDDHDLDRSLEKLALVGL
ncbi:MAG: hypothetical protein ABR581_08655 [Thermoleophilaceae bacterium]